jgi:hypothetical protein
LAGDPDWWQTPDPPEPRLAFDQCLTYLAAPYGNAFEAVAHPDRLAERLQAQRGSETRGIVLARYGRGQYQPFNAYLSRQNKAVFLAGRHDGTGVRFSQGSRSTERGTTLTLLFRWFNVAAVPFQLYWLPTTAAGRSLYRL